jgi:hypothetical protein
LDAGQYVVKICIVGVGNIGMRYVQGITKTFPDAQLFLVDGATRLLELKKLELGDARLLQTLDDIHESMDLCVVSTSCEPRLAIYKRCLALNPQYVILEKYLFKSRKEFEECLRLERVPTFVNQWMFGSKAFDSLFESGATSVELTGSGWGLACNAVHWIDVFKRHMDISHLDVGSDTAVSKVFPSKRTGYEEIFGELVFVDSDSEKTFKLIDKGDPDLVGMQEIRVDEAVYTFDFKQVKQREKIVGHFPYLSEVIGDITGEILEKGRCHLPLLEESISQHLLIEDILDTLDHRPTIT